MPAANSDQPKDVWSKNIYFIFACVGAATGLGSLWRFPYVAFKNGGGAFFFPYLICLLLIGLPLCLLEIGLGRWANGSIAAAYKKANRAFTWVGWWVLINSIIIVFYYCVVLAWCVQYFVYSFTEAWGNDPAQFFTTNVLHLTSGPMTLGQANTGTLLALAVLWIAIFFIVKGSVKGLSRVLTITVPLPLILLIVFVVRSMSLPGGFDGMAFLLTPRFNEITSTGVWASAASQVFLSLSLGMGQMVVYASKKKDDHAVVKSALSICGFVLLFSLLSGIITFAMMGHLAYIQGVQLTDLKLEGLFLAFVSYPMVISSLPLAPLWGILFFMLLITIGIDSAFAVIEATLAGAEEMTAKKRRTPLACLLCLLGFGGGIIFTMGGGLFCLDIVDHWVEKYSIPALILLECILFAGFAPINEIGEHIRTSWNNFPVKKWVALLKFGLPIILIAVFGGRIFQEGLTQYNEYPNDALVIGGWGVLIVGIVISLLVSFPYNKKS